VNPASDIIEFCEVSDCFFMPVHEFEWGDYRVDLLWLPRGAAAQDGTHVFEITSVEGTKWGAATFLVVLTFRTKKGYSYAQHRARAVVSEEKYIRGVTEWVCDSPELPAMCFVGMSRYWQLEGLDVVEGCFLRWEEAHKGNLDPVQ
jgi:hypothetical protein